MSVLNRLVRNRHLDDTAFAELWTADAAAGRDSDDSRDTEPHLAACAHCRTRYAAFTGWLDDLRTDAHGEIDEQFTPDRLAAQQSAVLRRLENLERPARVIAFPRFARPVSAPQSHVQRWIAAAAAAGLIIGLAAGQLFDLRRGLLIGAPGAGTAVTERVAQAPGVARDTDVTPAAYVSPAADDEALVYGDGELTLRSVRVSSLRPMDDITPQARDFLRRR